MKELGKLITINMHVVSTRPCVKNTPAAEVKSNGTASGAGKPG